MTFSHQSLVVKHSVPTDIPPDDYRLTLPAFAFVSQPMSTSIDLLSFPAVSVSKSKRPVKVVLVSQAFLRPRPVFFTLFKWLDTDGRESLVSICAEYVLMLVR